MRENETILYINVIKIYNTMHLSKPNKFITECLLIYTNKHISEVRGISEENAECDKTIRLYWRFMEQPK